MPLPRRTLSVHLHSRGQTVRLHLCRKDLQIMRLRYSKDAYRKTEGARLAIMFLQKVEMESGFERLGR